MNFQSKLKILSQVKDIYKLVSPSSPATDLWEIFLKTNPDLLSRKRAFVVQFPSQVEAG